MRRCPDASGTGCVRLFPLPAMRRCPDASGTGCVQLNSDASLPGCVRKLDASSSQRCDAARMRPETGCVQFAAMRRCPDASVTGCVQSTAMRRCPDASGTGCVQLNSGASLPGCVRNWMRPVISSPSDASLPGCVRNWMRPVKQRCVAARMCLELDASSQRRCVAARMRGKNLDASG
jgi:hypothetical protein